MNQYVIADAYVIANDTSNAITNAINAINQAIEATHELEKLQIFNYEEFTKPSVNLEQLKFKIPNEQPGKERTKWAEELLITLLNAFNLIPEMIYLSMAEREVLDNKYLYANNFILDCKKAAVGDASPPWWQEIEERMLKPNL